MDMFLYESVSCVYPCLCDEPVGFCIYVWTNVVFIYKLALLKNFLVSQLVILSAGMLILSSLLKCNSYLFLLSRIKVFLYRRNRMLFYNSYILPHLDFCCIICGNCSSILEDKLVKFQKRAARVILDCDLYTPSSELFKELNWQTFPERVTYQNAILM